MDSRWHGDPFRPPRFWRGGLCPDKNSRRAVICCKKLQDLQCENLRLLRLPWSRTPKFDGFTGQPPHGWDTPSGASDRRWGYCLAVLARTEMRPKRAATIGGRLEVALAVALLAMACGETERDGKKGADGGVTNSGGAATATASAGGGANATSTTVASGMSTTDGSGSGGDAGADSSSAGDGSGGFAGHEDPGQPADGFSCLPSVRCLYQEVCANCDFLGGGIDYQCVPHPEVDPEGFSAVTAHCPAVQLVYECDGAEDCPAGKYCIWDRNLTTRTFNFGECSETPLPCSGDAGCTLCNDDADCPANLECGPPGLDGVLADRGSCIEVDR
jgi:hypothetical protein